MINATRSFLGKWSVWSRQSMNRRIFGAMLTVGGLTFVVKAAAAAKDVVAARQFGTNDAMDAFFIALIIPGIAINLISGSLNVSFIPTYIKVRDTEGPEAAQRLFSNILTLVFLLLLAISAILAFFMPRMLPFFVSGFAAEKLALTRLLFYLLIPMIIISGLSAMLGAVLNAGERFALMALVPICTPLISVILLLLMGKEWGIYAYVSGILVGTLVEVSLLGAGLKRTGLSIMPRWHGMNDHIREVMRQYAPMAAGAFLMSGTMLVDQGMAAMLAPGSVAALNYGNKIIAVMQGIGVIALGTAVFPYFSGMAAANDWNGVRHTLNTYTRLIVKVTVPLTIIFMIFSVPIVRMLFERGAFTAADTALVARIQSYYILQTPCYVLVILHVRLISSLKKNTVLMWVSAMSLVVNAALDYLFIRWLGVAGIALSSAAVALLAFCYLRYMTMKLMSGVRNEQA